ncbi:hydantoinase B/oxoprolinase family protein [Desertibaculum subflavum]|uniref:hydantoinase B/oxoprolinase family protein n=1 Tax=Desertibaculum subflavum TaxID=2268458 RepID=UPI000E66001E
MTANDPLSPIRLQLMWDRLIAVVEEQALALIRTGFSTSTREAGDLSAGVFDLDGAMLAQAVTGTPGHINSMARSVRHFLDKFPIDTMKEGDVFLTNDPWKGTGHLHDFTFVTPTFRRGRMVALFASTCHVVDIGGRGMTADAREVYEEGLYIPLIRFAHAGKVDKTLIDIVRANVREPVQVVGDLYSLATCNDIGSKRLIAMMDEFGIDDLNRLGKHILEKSRAASLEEIRKIKPGTYKFTMRADGYDHPLDLVATMTIGETGIDVDFAGTSPVSSYGINVPICYTEAYASFGVKCIVAPKVPNNEGSLSVIRITAPEGCILNAPPPSPVSTRHVTGQMLPDVVFGCLHQALGGKVPAEGTSCLWNLSALGGPGRAEGDPAEMAKAMPFNIISFHSGGTGARPGKDGLSATAFPSGVRNMPVEINEAISPIVIWRKEYRTDSGGAGQYRGGLGQVMEVGNLDPAAFALSAYYDRIQNPPRGREGGKDGAAGDLRLGSGAKLRGKGVQTVPKGDRVVISMPGGGGLGHPWARDVKAVASDVRLGMVTPEAARRDYGVVVDAEGKVDAAATADLRRAAAE